MQSGHGPAVSGDLAHRLAGLTEREFLRLLGDELEKAQEPARRVSFATPIHSRSPARARLVTPATGEGPRRGKVGAGWGMQTVMSCTSMDDAHQSFVQP
jgi:hypothetical protein